MGFANGCEVAADGSAPQPEAFRVRVDPNRLHFQLSFGRGYVIFIVMGLESGRAAEITPDHADMSSGLRS